MVYERLTVRTRQDEFDKQYSYEINGLICNQEVKFTIVTKSIPGICLLATCKQMSEEAWLILMLLLNHIAFQRPRIVLDASNALTTVASPVGPLPALIGYYAALTRLPLLTYRESLVTAENTYFPDPASEHDLINNGYYEESLFHY
jgi:hypothetical protein